MLIEIIHNGLATISSVAKADGGVIEQLVILDDPPQYVRC
ncbi:hypothetical protein Godav_005554 [Gossypium davidsonii]|uniref:Uncharacterized protein n=1 Tax=Gossypium davidsonii TaxID=34287 RepID=A0A7J8S0X4_GOSDV|nr:hypothetical protein [Gossypium davidsonii]